MKPNLFSILRVLKGKKCVRLIGYGSYTIDFEGVKGCLDQWRERYQRNLQEFDEVAGEIENYFLKIAENTKVPRVEYLKVV